MYHGEIANLTVMLVEDESLVAMLIEDTLLDLGCVVVAKAATLSEALIMASSVSADIALLDVNLNGMAAYPVAELLRKRQIPYVFLTGYGAAGVPESLRVAPVLAKPFDEADLDNAIRAALAPP